jgi:preprotein translocase subunit SecA
LGLTGDITIESRQPSIRKHLLEYDDVMNKQRETVYGLRRDLLIGFEGDTPEGQSTNQREYILSIVEDNFLRLIDQYMLKDQRPDQWDVTGLKEQLRLNFGFDAEAEHLDLIEMGPEEARSVIGPKLKEKYKEKEVQLGVEALRNLERYIMLNIVDAQWKDHLLALDHLKEGIGLRGYGQKDPLVEYKRASYYLLQAMLERVDTETIRYLFNFQVQATAPVEQQLLERRRRQRRGRVAFTKANETAFAGGEEEAAKPVRNKGPRIGRNDPGPCGSGKKYKKCCGA